jgi:hypothetical protein
VLARREKSTDLLLREIPAPTPKSPHFDQMPWLLNTSLIIIGLRLAVRHSGSIRQQSRRLQGQYQNAATPMLTQLTVLPDAIFSME